jgi:hypothetical protein
LNQRLLFNQIDYFSFNFSFTLVLESVTQTPFIALPSLRKIFSQFQKAIKHSSLS